MYHQSQPQDGAKPITRDDIHLPQGECRFILLHPQVKGLRCACVGFSLNRSTPGSSCHCGHQACYHVLARNESTTGDEELKDLKLRIANLEESLEQERHIGRNNLSIRLSQLEELVDKYKVEMEDEAKTMYRGLEGLWNNVGFLRGCARIQEDRIEFLLDATGGVKDDIATLQSRQIDLDDASMRLEDQVDAITASDCRSQPVVVEEIMLAQPLLVPGSADVCTSPSSILGAPQAWTVHISLLPTASQPFPFEKDTIAYKRCLSRGLHRIVVIPDRGSQYFTRTVSQEFEGLLQGRLWMPLVAKICDFETLQGQPMLRQLPANRIDSSLYNYEFLRSICATVDLKGNILDLYIAMCHDIFSWDDLKASKEYHGGLEACWTHDPVLDCLRSDDDIQSRVCLDEVDKESAGDIIRSWSPPTVRLKRGIAVISRRSSIGSTDAEMKKPKLQSRQCIGTAVERAKLRAEAV